MPDDTNGGRKKIEVLFNKRRRRAILSLSRESKTRQGSSLRRYDPYALFAGADVIRAASVVTARNLRARKQVMLFEEPALPVHGTPDMASW
jgi:hypothetical protein